MKFSKLFFQSFLLGSICSLAFAPFHFFIAAIFSLSGFFLLLEKSTNKKEILLIGWFYGFGYFLAGIYWISISLLVEGAKFAWLIPLALSAIPGFLAIYFALFSISFRTVSERLKITNIYQKIFLFSIAWLFFELLRSILFTGFPWNLIGYIWIFNLQISQLASIFGIYGLSLFACLICLLPILFLPKNRNIIGNKITAFLLLFLLFLAFLFGNYEIQKTKEIQAKQTGEEKIKIRLVQPNIEQNLKWDPSQKYQNFIETIELANSHNSDDVDLVIFPESSVPYILDERNEHLIKRLKTTIPRNGKILVNALRATFKNKDDDMPNAIWNSNFLLGENGVENFYDKSHLVPFGEYIPLQKQIPLHKILPFLDGITDSIGFSEGDGIKTIKVNDNFSISSLICYEIIFSNKIIDSKNLPNLLVNVTNDTWFGNSSGPYQHFDMARLRAIEYGIPLARVANSGITAFIDQNGNIIKKINLNEKGIVDISFSKNFKPTFYLKHQNLAVFLTILFLLFFTRKRKEIS